MRKEQITVTNNSVCNSAENKGLEGKGMKRGLPHFKKRMVPAVSGALMGVMLMSTTCFAAGTGTSAVTQGLDRNAELRESGEIWIGKVPKHWDVLKLKSHTRMITPMRDKPEDLSGDIPWVV